MQVAKQFQLLKQSPWSTPRVRPSGSAGRRQSSPRTRNARVSTNQTA